MSRLKMPAPDQATLARRGEIVAALRSIVPGEGVIDTAARCAPSRPTASPPIARCRWSSSCRRPSSRSCRILRILPRQRYSRRAARRRHRRCPAARCRSPTPCCWSCRNSTASSTSTIETAASSSQPGVTNLGITKAVEHRGFYYAPDPSSQIACSIGGNVAENSGGVHCLKYGLTANNVLGIEMVLITGEVIRLGGKHLDSEGYDLLGVMTGSEGLLGVVTEGHRPHPAEAGDGARPADRLSARSRPPGNASPTSSPLASSRAAWR